MAQAMIDMLTAENEGMDNTVRRPDNRQPHQFPSMVCGCADAARPGLIGAADGRGAGRSGFGLPRPARGV